MCFTSISVMPKQQIKKLDAQLELFNAEFLKEEKNKKYLEQKISIVCNDCNLKSTDVNFNPFLIKCPKCESYNTDPIK